MKLGFLGTGAITTAVVRGLCAAQADGGSAVRITLSPRNTERSEKLAREFDQVSVASDNQAVVDGSDTVFVAVRPVVAEDVLRPLRFRDDQAVVSLVSTLRIAELGPLIEPARKRGTRRAASGRVRGDEDAC